MKKVRLFAVAAAMGMFASTVAAAEPTVKDSYVATWGAVDEIIKVDVGDKVVAPTATIKVVKESRTTDKEYAEKTDNLGIVDSTICYEGFTNVEGTDDNGDGYADAKILTAGIDNLTTQGWLHTDAKFFPSARTALFYVGLANGGDSTSGRFLAPGAAKKDVYVLGLAHKHLADAEAVLKHFEDEGVVKFNYDEDGYIKTVEMFPFAVTNDKGKEIGNVYTRITSKGDRYSDDEIKEAVVNALLNGSKVLNDAEKAKYFTAEQVATDNYSEAEDGGKLSYVAYKDGDVKEENKISVSAGEILIVREGRYGELLPVTATSSDLPTESDDIFVENDYTVDHDNDDKTPEVPNKIVIAIQNKDGKTYSKYLTVGINTAKEYTAKSSMIWDVEAGTFVKVADKATNAKFIGLANGYFWANSDTDGGAKSVTETVATIDGKTYNAAEIQPHALGLYHLETPANTSEKIVIYTDGLNLNISGLNTKKETMTLEYGDGKELTTSAVKLDGKWYPAVDTEAELVKVVEKVLGLTTLEGKRVADKTGANDFDKWVEKLEAAVEYPLSGFSAPERTNAKGEKEAYTPSNAFQHYKGTFCTYKVAEGEDVSSQVTFESNADAVDTSVAGVKDLTLTAKIGSEVVDTKTIKVVVAPKYERTYKNGRVATLKAFHLNGNLYAVYNYDWAAKTYTATFYAQDGVTVASTANGPL